MAAGFLQELRGPAADWLGRRLPACKQVAPLLSASLDRRAGPRERVTLKLHLLVCVYCVRYLRQLRFVREALRDREAAPADDSADDAGLPGGARQRIAEALRGRAGR